MRVLIAVPAFNEEDSIGEVLSGLPTSLGGVEHVEIVVVDDGSTDRTVEIARSTNVRVVSHRRNLGLGAAFNTAVREALRANADALVTIDADGQFDAGEIPNLLKPLVAARADVVTGSRFVDGARPEGISRSRYWGNRFFSRLLGSLLNLRLGDVSCGFRAYSREALYHLNLFGRFTYTQEAIFDLVFKGLNVVEVPVTVTYDKDRKSAVSGNLIRYGLNALKIIARTARDFKPLRFFGVFGGGVILAGLAMDLWMLGFFLRTGGFSPYKFVGFTGTGLLVLGVLILGFALLADMLDRLRVNQERVLYQQRRMMFGGDEGRLPRFHHDRIPE